MLSGVEEQLKRFTNGGQTEHELIHQSGPGWTDHLQQGEVDDLTRLSLDDVEKDAYALKLVLDRLCTENDIDKVGDIREHDYYQSFIECHDILEYRFVYVYLSMRRNTDSPPSSVEGFIEFITTELGTMDKNGEIADDSGLNGMCRNISDTGSMGQVKCAVAVCKALNGSVSD